MTKKKATKKNQKEELYQYDEYAKDVLSYNYFVLNKAEELIEIANKMVSEFMVKESSERAKMLLVSRLLLCSVMKNNHNVLTKIQSSNESRIVNG